MFNVDEFDLDTYAFQSTLKDLMESNPDFMYEAEDPDGMGTYVHTNGSDDQENWTPGCLIGQALYKHGVPLNYLKSREGASASDVLRSLGSSDGIFMEHVDRLQSYQDIGVAWGSLEQEVANEYGD